MQLAANRVDLTGGPTNQPPGGSSYGNSLVPFVGVKPVLIQPKPDPLPPMAPLPVKPVNPVLISPAPVDTPAPPVKPSGCGGGSCPLAQPPVGGGSVTITKTSAPMAAASVAAAAGSPAAGPTSPGNLASLPWWVWVLVALVVLAVLR